MVIPDGVTNIGARAFSGCRSLETVALPSGLRHIGDEAFALCHRLERVELPAAAELGAHAFARCEGLQALVAGEGNSRYRTDDGVLYSRDGTVLLACPAGRGGAFTVPDGVTRVCDYFAAMVNV